MTAGNDKLAATKAALQKANVEVLRQRRATSPARASGAAPCSQYVTLADEANTAAQEAIAAGDLDLAQKQIDIGFSWVASGEVCLALLDVLP